MTSQITPAIEDLNNYTTAYTQTFPYHWDETLLLRAYSTKIVEQLSNQHGIRLLSLGIGGQLVSQTLISKLDMAEYHIIEGSSAIIERYRAECCPPKMMTIHHSYFEDINFQHPFDSIEMGFVLEHVDNPSIILQRFRDFLKPGGKLFVSVPNARSIHRLLGNAAGKLDDIYSLSSFDRALGHKRYFDLASIKALVENAGYSICQTFGLVLKPLTTSQLMALQLEPCIETAFIELGYSLPDISNGILLIATRQ